MIGRVGGLALVVNRRCGMPQVQTLASIYFDTSDRRLSAQKAVLRVRQCDRHFVQTLKFGSGLTRDEWEWPVSGPTPDQTVITESAARTVIREVAWSDLRPMFESRIERDLHLLDDGAIELAVDRGTLIGPDGRHQPVSEIELELKAGKPADLYRLALDLVAALPMRPEGRTKAARGFALADNRPAAAVKAQRLILVPEQTIDSAMGVILAACFQQFTANERCVLEGHDPEGVHQARVALRRLRSALSLFRAFLPAEDRAWITSELRWLGEALGPARDWDVFATDLMAPVDRAFGSDPDLATLAAAVQDQRHAAASAMRSTLLAHRYTQFQLRFGLWLEERGWRNQPVSEASALLFGPLQEAAVMLIDRHHRRALKAGRHFAHLRTDDRHRVRILLKKLRYTVEFLRSLFNDKPVCRFLEPLSRFQDTLGHLNDVATAHRLTGCLAATAAQATSNATAVQEMNEATAAQAIDAASLNRAAGMVLGWHRRGLADDEPHLVAQWKAFCAIHPFWTVAHKRRR